MGKSCETVLVIAALSLLAATLGCGAQVRPPGYSTDTALTAAQNLERFALLEEKDRKLRPLDVRLPPGVDPEVLAPRDAVDRRARMSSKEVLAELAERAAEHSASHSSDPIATGEIDPVAATAAQRHYVRGRDAALVGRHYVAITEFYRALELDPDATPVLRELARSHLALGNAGKATEHYSRIAQIEPAHAEANFTLAVSAAARRDWEQAAALLARQYAKGAAFDHDPAAGALAQFTFAVALRSLGYDRASIEAARNASGEAASASGSETMYEPRLISLHRQQSELWRGIGDAHCRLGEYEAALEAYAVASVLPSSDPSALHPRVIFANLRLGRIYTAQHEMLAVLRGREVISDRDIRLCSYLADHVADVELLREEALRAYRESRDDPDIVRVAAALSPSHEAAALLGEYAERSPRDVRVIAELLTWFGGRDLGGAIDLVADLIESHPDLSGEYVSRLVFAMPRPSELLGRIRARRPAPSTSNIESRVLLALGALGEAWDVAARARERWPDERSVLWLQIETAALLEEPSLLGDVLAGAGGFDDPLTWMFRARAHRGLGEIQQAIEAAEKAQELASAHTRTNDPIETRILVELAMVYQAYAAAQPEDQDRRRWAEEAVIVAERVIEREPAREAAFELLLTVYGPRGQLSNASHFRETVQRLYDSDSESRLYARLAAEELIGQGRYEQALERLVSLYDTDPLDVRALALAVEVWTRTDQLDAAANWLGERLSQRPGDPALLEQWANVMLRQDRADELIRALSDATQGEPRNYAAKRLLESAYRATGQIENAFGLGEQRLLAMPKGVRRDVELAALYGGAGKERRALSFIEAILEQADSATFDQLVSAIAVLGRLESDETRRDELTLSLALGIIDRFPNAPLQIYGLGLRSLAKLDNEGTGDERFDVLVERAVRQMPRGAGNQVIMLWRDLAQALVNAGEPGAAARALRPITLADHLHEPPGSDVLAMIAIVADAASRDPDNARATIELVEDLAAIGRLPRMPGMDGSDGPTVATALYHASQIYSVLGDEAGVETLLRRALAIRPSDAMSLNNLGYMRIESGHDDDETIRIIERAHKLQPESAHVLDTIGWLRYRQGRLEDEVDNEHGNAHAANARGRGALSFIVEALAAAEEPVAEVYDHLGDVYWRLARKTEAIESWERAERLLGDSSHRQNVVQNLHLLQARGWGLLVADARELYDRMYGAELERVQEKLKAARAGREPKIAPTFAELQRERAKPQAAAPY